MSVLRKQEAELLYHFIIILVLLNLVNHSAMIIFSRNHFVVSRFIRGFVLKVEYFRVNRHQYIVTMLSYFKTIPTGRKTDKNF